MAGALIGQAFISASIQVLCERITSPEFIDLVRQKKLDELLLKKLKMTLLTLYVVLNDAEEKQFMNLAVREWLDELKHAVFDADDLLDEINTEALRCKLEGEGQTDKITNKVWNFLSTSRSCFYQSMNAKIEELLRRLESFVQQKGALGLTEVVGRKVSQRTPTTSLIHEPCVYGRDGDKKNLKKVLLSDDASKDDVSVLTIVGMGGVGKTTLARMLYNDNKVKGHFTVTAWACVSEDYDAFRVTKTLLESVTLKPCNMIDLNMLQLELREQVRGKKFLFVLDDLWNEKYIDWKCLQAPFTSGARGSKVIVTTRNKNVASVMQNVPIQYLKPLSHEDCWLLLAKHAFGNENPSVHPNLEVIGKQIAHKCNGLPLAAETLGGLLRSNMNSEEWDKILNSNIWELSYDKSDILPALGLSYHYLPTKLKRCFVYCSIFPKDYEFKIEDVVLLWMAEGLIPQPENGKRMEEMAKEYFDELVSRSLFQKSREPRLFIMHDLINDLAVFMSKGFCCRLEGRESHEVERVRHLSYARGEFDAALKFEPLNGANCLRTFLPTTLNPHYHFERYFVSKMVLQELLPSLRCLRVLSLSLYKNVSELPDSIGNLIHLRYLDVSRTAIERLPSVVCTLYNLQTLLCTHCSSLIELPADMRKLIDLRYLDISGTKIEEMPLQMGRLKSLRTLSTFVVGKSIGSSIGELRELPHLQGKLSILKLQNVVDGRDALQANLKDKKGLKELELAWGHKDADDSQKEKEVLDKLQPCVNLEKLTIRFYGGTNFPNWLGDSSFSNIQFMSLSDCNYCWSLPPVGRLPALIELHISKMSCVRRIGAEFYGGSGASVSQPFQSLWSLQIEEMPELEEWVPSPSGGQCPDFPDLRDLSLKKCPKLRGSLPFYLPRLTKLSVSGCGVLHNERATTTTSSNLKMDCLYESLSHLYIEDGCPSLLPLLETKSLSILSIRNFVDLQCLPNSNLLQSLTLENCPFMSSFPGDGLPTTLKQLDIRNCRRLELLPHEMMAKLTLLHRLEIKNSCDSMRFFPLGIFPNLSYLRIRNCESLESISIEGVEENLSHLNSLVIKSCPNLVSFAHGGLPAPNLTELRISGCESLKSFPERIHTLTALRKLVIHKLHEQLVAVEEGLQGLVSLRYFKIGGRGSEVVLERLLKEQLLPTNLHTLRIFHLSNLESLDGKGFQHLTSLHSLRIIGCESLQFLPVKSFPASLSYLKISECSALKKRYENKTGEDWTNISHIPCIKIDEEVII